MKVEFVCDEKMLGLILKFIRRILEILATQMERLKKMKIVQMNMLKTH